MEPVDARLVPIPIEDVLKEKLQDEDEHEETTNLKKIFLNVKCVKLLTNGGQIITIEAFKWSYSVCLSITS